MKKKFIVIFFAFLNLFFLKAQDLSSRLFCEKVLESNYIISKKDIPQAMSCLENAYLKGDANKTAVLTFKLKPILEGNSYELGKIYFYEAWLYYTVNNIPEAEDQLVKLDSISKKISNMHERTVLDLEELKIANNIEEITTNDRDLVLKNSLKIHELAEKLKSKSYDYHYFKARSAYKIADIYFSRKLFDKAELYLKEFIYHSDKVNIDFLNVRVLKLLGKKASAHADYKAAIDYYQKAVKLAENKGIRYEIYTTMLLLSDCYQNLNQLETSLDYTKQYNKTSDSLYKTHVITSQLMSKYNKQMPKKQSMNYWFVYVIVGLFLFVAYKLYRKEKDKTKLINDNEPLKPIEILKDSTDENELKTLISFAKENEEAFYAKFPEVYPEFYQKLNSYSPQLSSSEIKFAMYLKLKFTTKEISVFTKSTIKAVENKKYRMRKKMNLSSETDIYHKIETL